MLPNGGEQSVATEVDGKAHGYFKDSYGPPEYFVGEPNSLVLTDYRSEMVVLRIPFLASQKSMTFQQLISLLY